MSKATKHLEKALDALQGKTASKEDAQLIVQLCQHLDLTKPL